MTPVPGGVRRAAKDTETVLHDLLLRFRRHAPADDVAPMNFTSLPFPNDGGPIHLLPR
ncbi:cytochrome P450 [Rhodococcus gordoniae]|uniref:Cytochrome P450 n=1 Tax=Rhodococcus gordoniae TaxID=223392 RepID=A0A379LZJ5_9NOCA|nr:hypothetical protein [Rhodococcus gordoniae]SUE15504.1 cytochrome P450 [Rhodococcus gordoniae]